MTDHGPDGRRGAAPGWVRAARAKWTWRGADRPGFAVTPGPGQESVWDYPRPPAVVRDRRRVEVFDDGQPIAATSHSVRVLETASPPTFYLPPGAVEPGRLEVVAGTTVCEWKGAAEYLALAGSDRAVAWRYPDPFDQFVEWAGWVSFYPGRVRCSVDGEVVRPQAGGFYGGWITDDVVGPFKGDPGSESW